MTKNSSHIPSGYKSSPLGIIPEDWKVKKVKDVSTIKGRIGYRGYTVDDIVDYGNGAISLSPSNIVDGKLQFNSVTSITWEKYYESPEIMLCNGDIVMVKTGSSFGKVAFVDNLPQEATINPQFVIINNIKCDNKWLCYLFDSDCIQKNVHKIVVGGAIPTMSQEEIANFRIAVPPQPEQQRIVSVLSLWDTAIAKQTALIEKLTLRKRGLMQHLLTGKKRLKGFEVNPFKLIPFDKIAKIVNVKAFQINKADYQEAGKNPVVDQGQLFVAAYSDSDKVFKDVPFVLFGDHTRIIKWIDFPCVIGADGVQAIKSKESMDIKYLYYLLSNIELPNLGYSRHMSILKEKVFYVTTDIIEQKAISQCLSNADKEIEIQKQKLASLHEQKKGLMQVLLTGKKRIN